MKFSEDSTTTFEGMADILTVVPERKQNDQIKLEFNVNLHYGLIVEKHLYRKYKQEVLYLFLPLPTPHRPIKKGEGAESLYVSRSKRQFCLPFLSKGKGKIIMTLKGQNFIFLEKGYNCEKYDIEIEVRLLKKRGHD